MCKECSPERTARIERGYAQAERLGKLQNFLSEAPFVPSIVATGFMVGSTLLVGWVESLPL